MNARLCGLTAVLAMVFPLSIAGADTGFVPAADKARVRRVSGRWVEQANRGASVGFVATTEDSAALEVPFQGRGLVVVLAGHGLPFANLGQENLGLLVVSVDGAAAVEIQPVTEDRDVLVARDLTKGPHVARIVHRRDAVSGAPGVRIEGFRVLAGGEGELSFLVHGEANRFLTDVRAIVTQDGRLVRSQLVRNWMTGQCRMAGLPAGAGYAVEIRAAGWESHRFADVVLAAGKEIVLAPVYLGRRPDSTVSGVEYPHTSRPAIVKPGESFAARFGKEGARTVTVGLERRAGPAVISRPLRWVENVAREHDGRAEGTLTVAPDTRPGLYDLIVSVGARRRFSARAVSVVGALPKNPMFVTFGHLDTWGQEQAEYLERLADVSNLIAPDLVLVSNEVNAAYAAGALSRLRMPYLITFGNHRVSGHEEWYGQPVSVTDFGPDWSILNHTPTWHGDLTGTRELLESRSEKGCRIINAFESDAPVELLDRFRVPYIHDAHGGGQRIMTMGKTPTQRAGKENSSSFRVVRFDGCKAVSFTYAGHATAPIPMARTAPAAPLRVAYNGSTARIDNEWEQAFPQVRVQFVLPAGAYTVDRGSIESIANNDDGQFTVLSVRVDVAAQSTVSVTARRR